MLTAPHPADIERIEPVPTLPGSAEADRRTIARVAADRARALRRQAAAIQREQLEPLRAALQVRAGELELTAAALGDETDLARA